MKKNMRNALAISGLAIAMGTSGLIFEASANMNSQSRIQHSNQERMRTRKPINEKVTHNRRFVSGFVQSVDSDNNTMTVTQGSKRFSVTIPTTAKPILNRSWKEIKLKDIKVGNKVKISGTITDFTVTAKTIRDISLL